MKATDYNKLIAILKKNLYTKNIELSTGVHTISLNPKIINSTIAVTIQKNQYTKNDTTLKIKTKTILKKKE